MKLKKLLSLLASVVVATSASASVIACGTFITEGKGTEEKVRLTQDLRIIELGDFDTTPNTKKLLKRIKELNPDLDEKSVDVYITEAGTGIAQVKPKPDGKYTQEPIVEVHYSVGMEQKRQDLRDLFRSRSVVDLGALAKTKPLTETDLEFLKHEIVERKLLKPGIELDYKQLDITFYPDQTITIKPKADSTSYIPTTSVEIIYTIAPKVITKIGVLPTYPNEKDIKAKFQVANIGTIDAKQFDVAKIDANKGTAQLKLKLDPKTGKNKLYDKDKLGTINVSYQIALDGVVTKPNLGKISGNGRDKKILLQALNEHNGQNLNLNELDLTINRDGEAQLLTTGQLYVPHYDQKNHDAILINYQFDLKYAVQEKLTETLILENFTSQDGKLSEVFKANFYDLLAESNPTFDILQTTMKLAKNGNIVLSSKKDSPVYFGDITVSNYKIDLNKALKSRDVDKAFFSSNPEEIKKEILATLEKQNPGFDSKKVSLELDEKNPGKAILTTTDAHYTIETPTHELTVSYQLTKGEEIIPDNKITNPLDHQPKVDAGQELGQAIKKQDPHFNPND